MAKRPGAHGERQLTAKKIERLKGAGFYADGGGIYLKIDQNGNRRWVQRVTIKEGSRIDIGLGSYDPNSIEIVRGHAADNRRNAQAGIDPRKVSVVYVEDGIPSFMTLATKMHGEMKGQWRNAKHSDQWINTLTTYAKPIGGKRIDKITTADVRDVLSPIWMTKRETAGRVKQRMRKVFERAIEDGFRNANPVPLQISTLSKERAKVRNHPTVHRDDIGSALIAIQSSKRAWVTTKLCIEFIALTGVRSGEARLAVWSEVDLDKAIWIIPASRMKMAEAHKVPLSKRCVEILKEAQKLSDRKSSSLVFPSRIDRGKALSDNTLTKLMREREIKSRDGEFATVHGFRSTLRDWIAINRPDVQDWIAERVLAHGDTNKVRSSYQRDDAFELRVPIMKDWSEFVINSINTFSDKQSEAE